MRDALAFPFRACCPDCPDQEDLSVTLKPKCGTRVEEPRPSTIDQIEQHLPITDGIPSHGIDLSAQQDFMEMAVGEDIVRVPEGDQMPGDDENKDPRGDSPGPQKKRRV